MMAQGLLQSAFRHFKLAPETAALMQVRCAARKGTRERRAKKKVKHEVTKREFIPHNILKLEKELKTRRSKIIDDSSKQPLPLDDVYVMKFYQWKNYTFEEAVLAHRESNHPEMYNYPQAKLHARIELNMQGEKKSRFVENFTRTAPAPFKLDHGEERHILAFSKTPEDHEKALAAGALLAGGPEIVSQIQSGAISIYDFKYFIAHPNILPEIAVLRGIMKRKFPNPSNGSLDGDIAAAVDRFKNGITYSAERDPQEKEFGLADVVVGTIDMDPKHLEANFVSVLQDVYTMKPKRAGSFIRRCLLVSPPSIERLKVDHTQYLETQLNEEEYADEEEDIKESVIQ